MFKDKKSDFLIFLSATTLLIIIFSTMFLTAKLKMGSEVPTSNASTEFTTEP